MNSIELTGNWEEQKGKLKQKFAALTENDLLFTEGKKEEMLRKLQIKLGKPKKKFLKLYSLSNNFFSKKPYLPLLLHCPLLKPLHNSN